MSQETVLAAASDRIEAQVSVVRSGAMLAIVMSVRAGLRADAEGGRRREEAEEEKGR